MFYEYPRDPLRTNASDHTPGKMNNTMLVQCVLTPKCDHSTVQPTIAVAVRMIDLSCWSDRISPDSSAAATAAAVAAASSFVHNFSADEAVLAERARQHREMRLKGNKDLKDKVEELKVKLQNERERMQKEFESQVRVQITPKYYLCAPGGTSLDE